MGNKNTGIYRKFKVTRTDGEHKKGKKHDGCSYFVLDLNCDFAFVEPALRAYAKACKKDYPLLAKDILDILSTRPCGCRSVGECMHFRAQTPGERLREMTARTNK